MTKSSDRKISAEFVAMFLLASAVLALLLHGVWPPAQTLFSNDGPLGRLVSACHQLPARFTGCWSDLNGIGFSGGAAAPGISMGLQYLLKPIWFSKLYALLSLLLLGLGAWCFFVQMRLGPWACRLGSLAAMLNSCFFSVACWGVAAHVIATGLAFFAMAALADTTARRGWWRILLAGFAIGLGVVDGADVGAIWSLYVVAFFCHQVWRQGGTTLQTLVTISTRSLVMAVCAGFIAAQAVSSLIDTSITGVVVTGETAAGEGQPAPPQGERWDWATQWSLPVRETLGLVVPGLFGYRLDTPDGGAYWGNIGQDPAVTRYLEGGREGPPPRGFMRSSGGGFYAGVLVLLVAAWALAQSFRRPNGIFNLAQRQWLWFWFALAIVSLLLAFGRFAPFYQLVYALPCFSTIRNPIKFIYPVSVALIVLFTYGLDGLFRKYLPADTATSLEGRGKLLCTGLGKSEKSWLWGCAALLGITLLAWIDYAASRADLVNYLQSMQFTNAGAIADFSIRQMFWPVLFLILAGLMLGGMFRGWFSGHRARWAGVAMAALLIADLGRANLPWILYWNYQSKYASNPILDRLQAHPEAQRVTFLPGEKDPSLPDFDEIYHLEWLQQQFPYYNIQSLDIVDMPRKPADFAAYVAANGSTPHSFVQMWQLTNTRYLLGAVASLDYWNQLIPQTNQQIRIVQRFDLTTKPGPRNAAGLDYWTPVPNDHGAFALFEYPGALPRAQLLQRWEIQTNDQSTLAQMFSPDFDPHQTVLVAGGLPPDAAPPATLSTTTGTVAFASYSPRQLVLKSAAPAASVLLLNDHYDANWNVLVDGKSATLLRCNFIMRGVYLTAGRHTIEFRYQPSYGLLYVSLAAIVVSLVTLGIVLASRSETRVPSTVAAPAVAVIHQLPAKVAPPRRRHEVVRH